MRSILSLTTKTFGLVLMLAAMSSIALGDPSLPPVGAPEIDPSSIAAGAALLSGGVLWLTGRRRAK